MYKSDVTFDAIIDIATFLIFILGFRRREDIYEI